MGVEPATGPDPNMEQNMGIKDTRLPGEKLYDSWKAAQVARERNPLDDRVIELEQLWYDRLVDYCERNGMNYSEIDPRGHDPIKFEAEWKANRDLRGGPESVFNRLGF